MAFICQIDLAQGVEPEEGDYTCVACTACKVYTVEDDIIFRSEEEYEAFCHQTDV